jgi:hypothetical protein
MATSANSARAGRMLTLFVCSSVLPLGLGGCGSSSPKVSAMPAAATTRAAAASSAGARPAWARGLGAGVTVIGPATTPPGHDTPGAALQGEVNAANMGKVVGACPYFPPSTQAECHTKLAGVPAADDPTFKGFALGYMAIRGDQALVGATATTCVPGQKPACSTNNDPAAIFSTAKPFAALWAEAVADEGSATFTGYSLATCVKVGNSWYVYIPPTSNS